MTRKWLLPTFRNRMLLTLYVLGGSYVLSNIFFNTTMGISSGYLRQKEGSRPGSCNPIRSDRDVRISNPANGDFMGSKSNDKTENTMYILDETKDVNVFHVLWSHLFPLAKVISQVISKYAEWSHSNKRTHPLKIVVALKPRQTLLNFMVPAFPIPSGIDFDVKIEAHMIDDYDAFMTQHATTPDNCFSLQEITMANFFDWAFGPYFHFKANTPGYVASLLQTWVANMHVKYSSLLSDYYQQNNQTIASNNACMRHTPLVLFVERGCTPFKRTVFDFETGRPAFTEIIIPQIEAMGYATEFIIACNDNLQQFTAFSRANVVVSAHGAQLTNMMFMTPCHLRSTSQQTKNDDNNNDNFFDHTHGFHPAILEISFRFAWCGFRAPSHLNASRDAQLQWWKQHCPYPARVYHKADFFRLATGLDVRYNEVPQYALMNFSEYDSDANPIHVGGVLVNSSLVVEQLKKILTDNKYDYRSHPTYNGLEGINPYAIGKIEYGKLALQQLWELCHFLGYC